MLYSEEYANLVNNHRIQVFRPDISTYLPRDIFYHIPTKKLVYGRYAPAKIRMGKIKHRDLVFLPCQDDYQIKMLMDKDFRANTETPQQLSSKLFNAFSRYITFYIPLESRNTLDKYPWEIIWLRFFMNQIHGLELEQGKWVKPLPF